MTNPFNDLKPPANPFNDLASTEKKRVLGQNIATFSPDALSRPTGLQGPTILPSPVINTPQTFDQFLSDLKTLPRLERLPETTIEDMSAINYYIKSRPKDPFGKLIHLPGEALDELFNIGKIAKAHPLQTVASLVTFPFQASYMQLKDLLTQFPDKDVREFYQELLGTYTPEEAQEINRAFAALAISTGVGAGAASLAIRARARFSRKTTGISTLSDDFLGRLTEASTTPFNIKSTSELARSVRSIMQKDMQALTKGEIATTGIFAGGFAGGSAFGFVEAPAEEKMGRAIAYGLAALPFGLFIKGYHKVTNKPLIDGNKVSPDFIAQARQAKPLEIVGTEIPKVEETVIGESITKPIQETTVKTKTQVFATLEEAKDYSRVNPFALIENLKQQPDGTFVAETRDLRAGLPEITEHDVATFHNFVGTQADLVHTIIKTQRDVNPEGIVVIPGLTNPNEAIKLLPKDAIFAIHKRADDLFDVAIGGERSKLAGSRSQFARDGFWEGQPVSIDGKMYHYVNRDGNVANVKLPSSTVPIKQLVTKRILVERLMTKELTEVLQDNNNLRFNSPLDAALSILENRYWQELHNISPKKIPLELLGNPEARQKETVNRTLLEDVATRWKEHVLPQIEKEMSLIDITTPSGLLKVDFNRLRRPTTALDIRQVQTASLEEIRSILTDHEEFATFKRIFDELHPRDREMPRSSIEESAASNGFTIDRGLAGGYTIRDASTGDRLAHGFHTKEEAQAWIDKTGQARGPDLGGSDGSIPPIITNLMPSGAAGDNPINMPLIIPKVGKASQIIGETMNWINAKNRVLGFGVTPMRDHFIALDNVLKTNLYNRMFLPTQDAALFSGQSKRPWLERVKKEIAPLLEHMNKEERELVFDYIETLSPAEMMDHLFKSRKMSKEEIKLAKGFVDKNVDLVKIYRFRHARDAQLARIRNEPELFLPDGSLKPEVKETILRDLSKQYNMNVEDIAAVKMFDFVVTQDLNDLSLYGITRLADGIQGNSLSRSEFAVKNKLSPQQIKAAHAIEKMMEEVGAALGIDDVRLITGYMHHSARIKDASFHSAFLDQKGLKGQVPKERQFIAEMIRSGQLNQYERDPLLSLIHYIDAGFDYKEFLPTWYEAYRKAKKMIEPLGEAKGKVPWESIQVYMNELRGIPQASSVYTQFLTENYFDKLGLNIKPDVRRDFVNGWLALTNSAAIGYRPGMAIRDIGTTGAHYYARFGRESLQRAIYLAGRKGALKGVKELGDVIGELSPIEFATADELKASGFGASIGKMPDYLNRIAELGMKISGQPQVYEFVQTMGYLEGRERALRLVSDIIDKKKTKQQAFADEKIFTYDEPIIQEFDKLVSTGQTEKAAHYLGKATARDIGYFYGLSNHPYGWGTNAGRLMGQYGNWPVWTRSLVLRGLSRGTRSDRLGFATRFAISQAAIKLTGATFGLDLYSWYTLPSLIWAGGPVVSTAMDLKDLTSGSDYIKSGARRRLIRLFPSINDPRSLMLPGSYMLGDLMQAIDQAQNPVEFGARAVGISLVKKPRSWMDDL